MKKSFIGMRNGELDLESGGGGSIKRRRRRADRMFGIKPNTIILVCPALCLGTFLLIIYALYQNPRAGFVGGEERGLEVEVGKGVFPYGNLKNLVMVAGHSVYMGTNCEKGDGEESWYLESYQTHLGQAATFLEHIKAGVETAGEDRDALLLFSGGETRKDAGPRSEAQSYWSVAESHGWFGQHLDVRRRALTEEHARDSFENLLFSICRFRELTGSYPSNITDGIRWKKREKRKGELNPGS